MPWSMVFYLTNHSKYNDFTGLIVIIALIKSMRPRQWTKNVFVFVPLFFDRKLTDPASVMRTIAAFVLLCLMSSAV